MKNNRLCFITLTIMLLIFPTITITENYYNNHIYQKYKQQYSWLDKEIYYKVELECGKWNIDKKIILAIIHSESRGKRYAISSVGAIGYLQVMPDKYNGRKEALFDKDLNIEIGVRVFAEFLKQNKGNLIRAINFYERGHKQEINVNYIAEIIDNIYYSGK